VQFLNRRSAHQRRAATDRGKNKPWVFIKSFIQISFVFILFIFTSYSVTREISSTKPGGSSTAATFEEDIQGAFTAPACSGECQGDLRGRFLAHARTRW